MPKDTSASRDIHVDVVIENHRYGAKAVVVSQRAVERFENWGPSRIAIATTRRELDEFIATCAGCGFVVMDRRTESATSGLW